MLFGLFTIYQFPSQANLIYKEKPNKKHSEMNLEKVNNVPDFIVTKVNHLQSVMPLKKHYHVGWLFVFIHWHYPFQFRTTV